MRRMVIVIAAMAVGVVVAQGAPRTRPASQPANVKDYVFKKTEQATLKLHVYSPTDLKRGDKRPAIVFFFGGGWKHGSANQFRPQAAYLSGRGMVAATSDYRVLKRHNVLPDKCVEDAKSAVRWMRQNAAKLGIDPDRIVAAGGSAGAHLAVCTALTTGLEAPGEDHNISSKPNALILFNPVLDLSSAKGIKRVGGNETLALQISPQQHLKAGAPPTLLLFGTVDRLFVQADPFIKRSQELGNRIELYTAEGAQHGFFNRSPWYERTLARADEFLVSIGYLPGKPTTRPSRRN